MERIPTWIAVSAVAMHDSSGRWLMHRRPLDKHHGGLWEFPGGKVDPGENPRAALVREIREELGLDLDPDALEPAAFAESEAGEGQPAIVILLYTTALPPGEPHALEGGEIGWFAYREVARLPMPPLDVALTRQLFARRIGGVGP